MRIAPLEPAHLADATGLLERALPYDRVAVVAQEKLFGDNGARTGFSFGAFDDAGTLTGVMAMAGRWIKLLAVEESRRRQGIATQLLATARAHAQGKLRIFDHPGNYLSPGIDIRYEAAEAFLRARGFSSVNQVENIRVPTHGRFVESRAEMTALQAKVRGYLVRRAEPSDHALLEWIERVFHAVWRREVERALAGPRRAVFAAFTIDDQPVAFAAADGNNQGLGWFGPTGTDPQHRGSGLGEALLLSTLRAVDGLPEAGVIAWLGPKEFYQRVFMGAAVDDRRFCAWEES